MKEEEQIKLAERKLSAILEGDHSDDIDINEFLSMNERELYEYQKDKELLFALFVYILAGSRIDENKTGMDYYSLFVTPETLIKHGFTMLRDVKNMELYEFVNKHINIESDINREASLLACLLIGRFATIVEVLPKFNDKDKELINDIIKLVRSVEGMHLLEIREVFIDLLKADFSFNNIMFLAGIVNSMNSDDASSFINKHYSSDEVKEKILEVSGRDEKTISIYGFALKMHESGMGEGEIIDYVSSSIESGPFGRLPDDDGPSNPYAFIDGKLVIK